jgi:N-acetylglucosamine repressor
MERLRGRNAIHTKVRNRSAILRLLLRNGPMARRDIARILHLTPATITNATRELLDHGLIAEMQRCNGDDPQKAGKVIPLMIHREASFAVGVNLGLTSVSVGIIDLCGQSRTLLGAQYGDRTAQAIVTQTADLIAHALEKIDMGMDRVVGVGVGVPGIVDPDHGMIRSHLGLNWVDVPFGALLSDALCRPVRLVNNVHSMAACERMYGVASEVDNFSLVFVSTHIGAGMVIGGELYEGFDSAAGGLAHLCVEPGGPLCSCGNRGCLQAVAGNLTLLQDAQRAIHDGRETKLRLSDVALTRPSAINRLFVAARRGDALAIDLLRRQAHYVGLGIASLLYLLDPELVVLLTPILDYDIDLGGVDYLGVVRQTVRQQARLIALPDERLVGSHFGSLAPTLGSAAVVFDKFLEEMPFMDY